MPRKNIRRAASKEALKQMQLLSDSANDEEGGRETETYEITSDEEIINIDMPPKKKYRLTHRKSSDGNDRDVIVFKTVNSTQDTLKLETWVEDLSESQLACRSRVDMELQDLDLKLEQIRNNLSAELVYQGENSTAYEVDNIPALTIIPEAKKKLGKVIPAKMNQKGAQKNVVLQTTKSNNTQSGYQLVMGPRLGLIVGTMTPAAGSSGQTQVTQKSAPPNTVQTRQTRRRGRNSVAATKLQQATPSKIQKPVSSQPSSSSSLVQLRPTETTSVGGLSTTTGSIQKSGPAGVSSIVDLTTDDGRPAADSREISFNKLQGKTFPSLVVVARPHLTVKDISGGDRTKLDAKVKSVLMHVPTKFTEWLIQQGLVRSEQNCTNHANTKLKLGMYSDVSKFPYSGGYVWISECCPHRFVSVFSGSLFEGAPHPPSVILKLIYHWSCQTNVQNVVQWVKVDNLYVKGMNTWLRALCTVALHSHVAPLGGPGRRVEVGVISLGTTSQDGQQRQVKVEVLGLLETDLKRIRLRAVEPLADGDRNYKKRFSKILEPLVQWVHPESIIITDLTVDKTTLQGMGFVHVQQSTTSDHNPSNHSIMEYLRRIVPRMFQNTLSLLSRQIIQQFLDELVWREWYGTTAAACFDNMLAHLSEQTRADTGHSLIMRLNKIASNPFKNWSVNAPTNPTTLIKSHTNESASLPTKRTSNRQRKIVNVREESPPVEDQQPPLPTPPPPSSHHSLTQRPPRNLSPDVPEEMVPLENYYYGTIEGFDPNANIKIGWNMKCSMCKTTFSNNIKLMTHLFSHAHSITAGIQQCRYCLSSVGSQEGLAKHILSSHPYQTQFQDGFICVICETRFPNFLSLGKHLSKEHVPAELPYQCGTCSFRCSSHRQAIDHFYQSHNAGATIQCPFCLKSTTVWSGGRIMPQNLNYFMQHLQKHQKKAMAKKCPKCALWFIHKDTLKDHQIKMHLTQRRKAGLNPWSSPKNGFLVPKSKQDIQVWEDSEREININNLTISAPNNLICKECKISIGTVRHYQSLESCSNRNCQFLTCCKTAMERHGAICTDLNASLPIFLLPKPMYCVCGYSEEDGNILAKHLAECERKSAYPSIEAAKLAIKTHSMLDVLGLVRRPEEKSQSSDRRASATEVVECEDGEIKAEASPKKVMRRTRKRKLKDVAAVEKSSVPTQVEEEDKGSDKASDEVVLVNSDNTDNENENKEVVETSENIVEQMNEENDNTNIIEDEQNTTVDSDEVVEIKNTNEESTSEVDEPNVKTNEDINKIDEENINKINETDEEPIKSQIHEDEEENDEVEEVGITQVEEKTDNDEGSNKSPIEEDNTQVEEEDDKKDDTQDVADSPKSATELNDIEMADLQEEHLSKENTKEAANNQEEEEEKLLGASASDNEMEVEKVVESEISDIMNELEQSTDIMETEEVAYE